MPSLRTETDQQEYSDFCSVTDHYPDAFNHNAKIMFHALGMAGEAGEVANKVKKIFRDDKGEVTDQRRDQIARELGGVYWYFTRLAADFGFTVEDIRDINWKELESRRQRGTVLGDGDDR